MKSAALKCVLSGIFCLVAHEGRAASAIFTLTNTTLPVVSSSAIAVGDLNNDGHFDVVISGANSNFVPLTEVFLNAGNGTFQTAGVETLPALTKSSIALGDYNHDGLVDVLITGFAGLMTNRQPILVTQLWRNNGDGTFVNSSIGFAGVENGSVAWGDFYGDGNLGFILTGESSAGAITQIWRNLGNGKFAIYDTELPAVSFSSVALADFDGDGLVDILITGTTDGSVSGAVTEIWRNLGNGIFTNVNAGLPGVFQGAVAWGDFDNDGRPDILLTGNSTNGPIAQIWKNLGRGVFSNLNLNLPGVYQSAVAVADFDNDGRLDFVLTGLDTSNNPIAQAWRNLGNGTFANISAGLPGVQLGAVALADFENSGNPDLVLTGLNSSNRAVGQFYHNNTAPVTNLAVHLNPAVPNHGKFQISFDGKIGEDYLVLETTNFVKWTSEGPPFQIRPGVFQFIDAGSLTNRSRFFRVSAP